MKSTAGVGGDEKANDEMHKKGYKYFGAAKQLPGVKQLFETGKNNRTTRKTKHQINKTIDADYYGFRDEEDGVLLREEAVATKRMRGAKCEAFDLRKKIKADMGGGDEDDADPSSINRFVAHVPLPEKTQIEALVLEKKKKDLLAKYSSETLIQQQGAAREMLNKR